MEGFDPTYFVTASLALTTTGDKATFAPGQPINVRRIAVIANALIDVGAGMTIKVDHRPTAGSDTGRTDGIGKDLVVAADIAQGKGEYAELPTEFEVDPGEELVVQVTDAADTAGTGYVVIEYQRKPFTGTRIANMTKQA